MDWCGGKNGANRGNGFATQSVRIRTTSTTAIKLHSTISGALKSGPLDQAERTLQEASGLRQASGTPSKTLCWVDAGVLYGVRPRTQPLPTPPPDSASNRPIRGVERTRSAGTLQHLPGPATDGGGSSLHGGHDECVSARGPRAPRVRPRKRNAHPGLAGSPPSSKFRKNGSICRRIGIARSLSLRVDRPRSQGCAGIQ